MRPLPRFRRRSRDADADFSTPPAPFQGAFPLAVLQGPQHDPTLGPSDEHLEHVRSADAEYSIATTIHSPPTPVHTAQLPPSAAVQETLPPMTITAQSYHGANASLPSVPAPPPPHGPLSPHSTGQMARDEYYEKTATMFDTIPEHDEGDAALWRTPTNVSGRVKSMSMTLEPPNYNYAESDKRSIEGDDAWLSLPHLHGSVAGHGHAADATPPRPYDLERGPAEAGPSNAAAAAPLGDAWEDSVDRFAGPKRDYGDLTNIDSPTRSKFFREDGLRVGIQQRHVQMIALTGTIGVGIWLNLGQTLSRCGPLLLLCAYLTSGIVMAATMLSLGEVTTLAPVTGAYARHSSVFSAPSLGFATGWNLVIYNAIACAGEVTSCAVLIQYWTDISPAVFVTILGLAIVATNIVVVRAWAETEFYFALIKLIMVVGIIILCICLDLGAGPAGHMTGFQYWRNPGPAAEYLVGGAAGRFCGYWSATIASLYSYANCEAISLLVAETSAPRRGMVKATKRVFVRIFACYLGICFAVGLVVASNDPLIISRSPFVVAVQRAGIRGLESVINAGILISAWSAADSLVLNGSRSLICLAQDGHAPEIFLRVHRWGVPYVAVLFVCVWIALAYMSVSETAETVFQWAVSFSSSGILWIWGAININCLQVYYGMKKQGIPRSQLPWPTWGQPYSAWLGLGGCVLFLITGGYSIFIPGKFSAQVLVSAYACPLLDLALLIGYMVFWSGWDWTKLQDVPILPWLIQFHDNPEPPEIPQKTWKKWVTFIWA